MIALALLLLMSACGNESDREGLRTTGKASSDPGPVHVHGLGVNPADRSLFIATHTGLFRMPKGSTRASRVAGRYQDTMGFAVVGPDRFLGSGHPDGRDNLPPFLGLIRSSDAGRSWTPVSLLGEADFHVLEALGRTIYGYGADFESRREQFLVSQDGGRNWRRRPAPQPIVSLAVDPRDPDRLVASGPEELLASSDGGRYWSRVESGAGLLSWSASQDLFRVDAAGTVSGSADGRTWVSTGKIGGRPAAFEVAGRELYVALHDGTIKQSGDGGRTWAVRLAAPD